MTKLSYFLNFLLGLTVVSGFSVQAQGCFGIDGILYDRCDDYRHVTSAEGSNDLPNLDLRDRSYLHEFVVYKSFVLSCNSNKTVSLSAESIRLMDEPAQVLYANQNNGDSINISDLAEIDGHLFKVINPYVCALLKSKIPSLAKESFNKMKVFILDDSKSGSYLTGFQDGTGLYYGVTQYFVHQGL